MSDIKLISFNCRGLGDYKKRKDVFGYLRNLDFNICLLQDVHCRKIGVPYFRNAWGTDVLIAPYSNNARGVAILTKNIGVQFRSTAIDEGGNFIITKMRVNGTANFCLANVYGPNSDSPLFYKDLSKRIQDMLDEEDEDVPIIIAGDLNLTLDQKIDNHNYRRENNTRAREAVKDMLIKHELMDIYRERNPGVRRYTWRVGRPVMKQARLDMFLISNSLEGYVKDTNIQPGYRSDHSIVTLRMDIAKQPRGKGLFKFNASLLNDANYVNLVKKTIKETVQEYAVPVYSYDYIAENPAYVELKISSSLFFEVLIMVIRRETISFGIKKKREERNQEKSLMNIICQLEKEADETGIQEIGDEVERKKKELEKIREKRLQGSLVRARAIWREQAEKPSKILPNAGEKKV